MARNFAKSHNLTGFRLVINNGQQAGETVPHLQVHLLSGRLMGWPPGCKAISNFLANVFYLIPKF
jgi:histidine triad (HIT) family protein